ncbi:MAG: hypothetical protein ACJAXQ_001671 [Parvibaculaceae bacterium]|jgi:hypothetical protein
MVSHFLTAWYWEMSIDYLGKKVPASVATLGALLACIFVENFCNFAAATGSVSASLGREAEL